jgi:hypothetical protein
MRGSGFWKPVIASLIVTPIALILGLGSAGGGHGDYILATYLFPFAVLLISLLGGKLPAFVTVTLAVAQFPLYGIILGLAAEKKRFSLWLLALLGAHALATVVCFLLRSSMST